jgi:hypothetical protein
VAVGTTGAGAAVAAAATVPTASSVPGPGAAIRVGLVGAATAGPSRASSGTPIGGTEVGVLTRADSTALAGAAGTAPEPAPAPDRLASGSARVALPDGRRGRAWPAGPSTANSSSIPSGPISVLSSNPGMAWISAASESWSRSTTGRRASTSSTGPVVAVEDVGWLAGWARSEKSSKFSSAGAAPVAAGSSSASISMTGPASTSGPSGGGRVAAVARRTTWTVVRRGSGALGGGVVIGPDRVGATGLGAAAPAWTSMSS